MAEHRQCDRYALTMPATARPIGGRHIDLQLKTLSDTGFSGSGDVPPGCDITVVVQLPVVGDAVARLIWTNERAFAGEFLRPVNAELIVDRYFGF